MRFLLQPRINGHGVRNFLLFEQNSAHGTSMIFFLKNNELHRLKLDYIFLDSVYFGDRSLSVGFQRRKISEVISSQNSEVKHSELVNVPSIFCLPVNVTILILTYKYTVTVK